jgi:hypothetical protein
MNPARKHSDFALYRRLMVEARPFWWHIAGLFALSLLATPLTLLNPLPLKIVVDSVLGPHELPAWLARLFPAGVQRTDVIVIAVVAGMLIAVALAKQLLDLAFAVLREAGMDVDLTTTIQELEDEMLTAANNLEFEKAALLRDQIKELKRMADGEAVPAGPSRSTSYRKAGGRRQRA